MSLTPDQLQWLVIFTGGLPEASLDQVLDGLPDPKKKEGLVDAVNARRREEARQRAAAGALAVVRQRVDALTEKYASVRDGTVKTTGGTKSLISPKGQHEAFGVWSTDLATEVPTAYEDLRKQAGEILDLRDELLALRFRWDALDAEGEETETWETLFENADLEAELYTPLVRQLAFPEDQVTDPFSRTQQMIDAVNARYLEEARKSTYVEQSGLQKAMPIVRSLTSTVSSLVGASGDVVASFGDKGVGETVTLMKNITTITETVINTTALTVEHLDRSNATDAASSILDGVAGVLKVALGAFLPKGLENPNPGQIASYVSTAVATSGALPKLVGALTTDGPMSDRLLLAYGELSKGVIKGMGLLVVEGSSTDKANVALTQKLLESVVELEVNALKSGGTLDKFVAGDRAGAMADLAKFANKVVLGVLTRGAQEKVNQEAAAKEQKLKDALADWNDRSESNREALLQKYKDVEGFSSFVEKGYEAKDTKDYLSAFTTGIKDDFASRVSQAEAGTIPLGDAIGGGFATLPKLDVETCERELGERRQQLAREREEQLRVAIEEESAAVRKRLEGWGGAPPIDHLGMLMADIQKERMVLQIFQTAGSLGFQAAGLIFAPMAAGGTLVACLAAARKAVIHFNELALWRRNQSFAENAVSPLLTSVMNFVDTESVLADHATAEAIIQGIKFAAEIAASAGTGTPVQGIAKLVSVTASAASTTREIIQKQVEEAKLEKAWKVTKIALHNPKDRVSNLVARRLNPTLAKYTIAWGATVQKDVVAMELMATIGLTREALDSPDDKAQEAHDKLVAYLELRYDEHRKLVRPIEERVSWGQHLPKPATSLRAWTASIGIAIEQGGLSPAGTLAVSKRFEAVTSQASALQMEYDLADQLQRTVDEGGEVDPVEIRQKFRPALVPHRTAVTDLDAALAKYQPLTLASAPHAEFGEVVEAFRAEAQATALAIDALDARLERIAATPKPVPTGGLGQAQVGALLQVARLAQASTGK